MSTALEAFEAALLADVAYVDFSDAAKTSEAQLRADLEASGRLTTSQINYFVERFEVAAFTSVPSVGFEAVVFRDRNDPNNLTVGMRGTEFSPDTDLEDIQANLALGLFGLASDQAEAMVAFVQSLRDGSGGNPPIIDTENDTVSVTGHSLGGHLVQFAVRIFPTLFNGNRFTFNGAGIGGAGGIIGSVAEVYSRLRYGESFISADQFTIENYVSQAGAEFVPSLVSGLRPGTDFDLFIE